MIPFNIADHNLIFIVNGRPYNVGRDHMNFTTIREKLLTGNFDPLELVDLADIQTAIHKFTAGKIEVREGREVFYNGSPLHNVWTEKLLGFLSEGLPIDPLVAALESLQRNPSFMARERLPLFQEHNQLGFLPDGRLTGLKAVRSDFMDKWEGKFDNTPGKICRMDRVLISDDPNVHCAPGLHVGSWEYVASYGNSHSDKIILVAFWPHDVVAVPQDLQTKIRVCEYESLSVLDRNYVDDFIRNNQIVVTVDDNDDDDNNNYDHYDYI